MTLNRQILRKIDDKLRTESEEETGEWMAKVPISGATKAVWQRYCQTVGVHMGQGVAILIHHELASVVDEDIEALSDRLKEREAELDEQALAVDRAEKQLEREQRDVEVREARVTARERDLASRETNLAVAERRLAGSLPSATRTQQGSTHKEKLGRNEPCWCESGKKYKNCHLASDQSG
jgi:uncharacterized protein YchJ